MPELNILDWALAIALFAGAMQGYTLGLIRQFFSLAGWILAFAAAWLFHDDVVPLLESQVKLETEAMLGDYGRLAAGAGLDLYRYIYNAMAFAAVFFGAKLAVWFAGRFLHGIASLPVLRTVNRVSGALLGLIQAVAIAAIVLLILDALPYEGIRELLEDSFAYAWLEQNKPALVSRLGGLWQ